MAIENERWIEGTAPIEDEVELRRVEQWLVDFASDTSLWSVAWRLLRTCKAKQETVDKLPKTADGMPVVPGMDIWTDGDNGPRQVAVLGIKPSGVGDVSFYAVEEQLCFSLHGYSTREAAEAANKTRKDPADVNEPDNPA